MAHMKIAYFGPFVLSHVEYTLCLKKMFPPFNILPIFKIFALLESLWNLLQNPNNNTHLTLNMLLHYLGKLKIQIFCRHSADMEENANESHFKCL